MACYGDSPLRVFIVRMIFKYLKRLGSMGPYIVTVELIFSVESDLTSSRFIDPYSKVVLWIPIFRPA